MKMRLIPALLLLLVPVGAIVWAQQQDLSKVEIKTIAVAGNVHMLQGEGGNIGVSAGPDGLLIVDDEFAPLAPKMEAAIKANQLKNPDDAKQRKILTSGCVQTSANIPENLVLSSVPN